MLNGDDVIAAVASSHTVPHKELEIALVLGIAVAVDVHHDGLGSPAPQMCQLERAVPVAAMRGT